MCEQKLSFCPACGKEDFQPYDTKAFRCNQCGFLYYHNVAATSSAIINIDDEILMVYRAHEPCKGMLDLPGGFIEKAERAEVALVRELNEELGIKLKDTGEYLCNFTNLYEYAGIKYNTLDMYFLIQLDKKPMIKPADDVADYRWINKNEIKTTDISFISVKQALEFYRQKTT